MAAESSRETGEDKVEPLIDDLIRDILNESGPASEGGSRGRATTAALYETAIGSPREPGRVSALERVLLAEAFATELAEALAPALAEHLAPRLMKALDELATSEAAGKKPAAGARSGSEGRKSGGK